MKETLILAAGCGLLASVAFAQTRPAGSAPAAQDFVNQVAISDMFEIQSSQLALSKQPSRSRKRWSRTIRRRRTS